ncbi:hypothetical protein DL93DRAFT_2170832 [Clavulina sp. PMI_390]|nr:hypothetical protein DL93DRAFT_2170832 [Clavulina sp. PMI_390]
MSTIPAFVAARESIESLDNFLNTIDLNATPIIIHNPPSTRSSHQSTTRNRHEMLETFCSEVEVLFDKLSFMRQRLLLRRAVCAGALSPVTAMPVELLREVFRLVVEASPSTLPALLAVCHPWRSIVSQQHELWGSVALRAGDSFGGIVAHRDHGGSLPLALSVDACMHSWPHKLRLAFPDMGQRLESLHWSTSASLLDLLDPEDEIIFSALHTIRLSIPYLCEMCGDPDELANASAFIASVTAPSLRRLEIDNVHDLEIPDTTAKTLEHLVLSNVEMHSAFFADLLQVATSLKSLVIGSVRADFAESAADIKGLTILPCLETLQFDGIFPELVEPVLKICECPNLRSLKLSRSTPRLGQGPHLGFLGNLATFLDRAPQMRELIVTQSDSLEIPFVASTLRTHGGHIERFIFSILPFTTDATSILPHLAETMRLRRESSLPALELETSVEWKSMLQETFPDISIVVSTREDCTYVPSSDSDSSTES